MADLNLNQTTADCIKHTSDFTQDVIYNICTGAKTVVPYGNVDILVNTIGLGLIGALMLMLLTAIIGMILSIIMN